MTERHYQTAFFCTECEQELSNHERMYSHGRCPRCGFKGQYACTICYTFERGFYMAKIDRKKYPWWNLWKKMSPGYERVWV